jgi:hypothetical protein
MVQLAALLLTLASPPPTETQKIEMLISYVEKLDAVFIRNGSEHEPRAAAKHMRDKWDHSRSKIVTADAFITHIASYSSMTGKPYLVRFRDGREVKSGELLRAELSRIEGKK